MSKTKKRTIPEALKKDWMDMEEACEQLSCHRDTVDRKVASGLLVKNKLNGMAMISRKSVQKYLNQYRVR